MSHRKLFISLLWLLPACIVILSGQAYPQTLQRVEIPSSFNPVGSGARALGMGGAFIAQADDATAASWNPGGLYQLKKPEISFVGAIVNREEDNRFATNPEADGREQISYAAINYMSVVYPFQPLPGGQRLIVSANYQRLYDMRRSWRFPLQQTEEDLNLAQDVDYRQTGALTALGISLGTQLTPHHKADEWGLIGVGVTLNFWDAGFNENQWEQRTRQTGSGTLGTNAFVFSTLSQDRYTLRGINANIGIHWRSPGRPTKNRFHVGVVYKTALKADLVHRSRFESDLQYPDQPSANSSNAIATKTDEELEFPSTIGLGLAWEPRPRQTVVTLDIYRTDWGEFVLEDENGYRTSPISGKPIGEADIDPTYPARMGFQHIFGYLEIDEYGVEWPLRLGAFYDPAPAEGSPDEFYGFSLGSGVFVKQARRNFALDIAYQMRFARDVGASILQNLGFEQDVTEHTLYTSMIVRF